MSSPEASRSKVTAVLRGDQERVMPLELFFDLVFVLAITQCTALMSHDRTWAGLGRGLLVLGVLWWAWVGYAWFTSVVDPEEGTVRLVLFAAMAALLIVALAVPEAFGSTALLFACAYAAVRIAQIGLFLVASHDDPSLRSSVQTLAGSTAIGSGLLIAAAFVSSPIREGLWALAIVLDMAGPFFFGVDGWRLVPGHFAERHGLILLIALGESIVAIGVGAGTDIDSGVVMAAIGGMAVTASLWWLYFDVVALVAARRLENAAPGRERNAVARDSFSYLHLPMVAGIVLVALGFKVTLADVGARLALVPAAALLGGTALYLLAHVAFRWRNVHRLSRQRLAAAGACVLLVPLAERLPALAALAVLAALLLVLITYERVRFAELRARLRQQAAA